MSDVIDAHHRYPNHAQYIASFGSASEYLAYTAGAKWVLHYINEQVELATRVDENTVKAN